MPNSFFNNLVDLIPFTRARAGDVEANFSQVEAGFDGVETAIQVVQDDVDANEAASIASFDDVDAQLALKAPLLSPEFSGNPRAPTQATNATGNLLATLDYVIATAFASITNLPGQLGNAGKLLTTDGTSPSWGAISARSGGSSVSAPVTLTDMSDGALNVATTAAGQALTLPDATTLTEGVGAFSIKNTGGFDLLVRDDGGTLLCFVRPLDSISVSLVDSTTAAGAWSFQGECLVGISAMQDFTGITSGDQLTTLALNGGRVLHLTAGTTLYGVIYDEVNNTWGSATLIASAISAASFRATLDANDVVLVAYCTATSTVGRTLSISGTSITVNAAATQSTNPITTLIARATGSSDRYTSHHNLVKSGSSYVLTGTNGSTEVRTIAFTVTGTTVAVGSTVSLATLNAERTSRVESLASGQVVVFLVTSATVYTAQPYTVSGTTLTAGTAVTFAATATYSGFKSRLTTDGRLLVAYAINLSGGPTSVSIISVAANVATASSVASGMSVASGSNQGDLIHLGSEKYFFGRAQDGRVNIITNTAGVVSAGTPLSVTNNLRHYVEVISPSLVMLHTCDSNGLRQAAINTSGASPTLVSENLRTPRVDLASAAGPLFSLEDGSRHPATLIGANLVTGAVPMSVFSDSASNSSVSSTTEHVVFGGSTVSNTPAVEGAQLSTSWNVNIRRISTGSANSKSWACLATNANTFYIAQVEFAG